MAIYIGTTKVAGQAVIGNENVSWAEITEKPSTFPPPLMSTTVIGGALIGNGLTVSGNYLLIKTGIGLQFNATDFSLEINKTYFDGLYASDIHTHSWTEITEKPTTFSPPLASGTVVGGARVGNGLTMAGEYLTIRAGTGLLVNATTYALDLLIASPTVLGGIKVGTGLTIDGTGVLSVTGGDWDSITGKPLVVVSDSTGGTGSADTIWTGTEAQYQAIVTKDPTTLYYIVE